MIANILITHRTCALLFSFFKQCIATKSAEFVIRIIKKIPTYFLAFLIPAVGLLRDYKNCVIIL